MYRFLIFPRLRQFSLLLADLLFFHATFEELGCASVDRTILPCRARNNDYPSSSPNKESQSACLLFVHGAPQYYVMAWHNYRVRQRAVYGKRSRDTNLRLRLAHTPRISQSVLVCYYMRFIQFTLDNYFTRTIQRYVRLAPQKMQLLKIYLFKKKEQFRNFI